MRADEIVLPITKPETEWVRGRALQKMSPTRTHAALQADLLEILREWADDRGDVLSEWRFRIAVGGEPRRPLVPDIAFVWHERLRCLNDDDLEVPPFAPDVAVEILLPGDRFDRRRQQGRGIPGRRRRTRHHRRPGSAERCGRSIRSSIARSAAAKPSRTTRYPASRSRSARSSSARCDGRDDRVWDRAVRKTEIGTARTLTGGHRCGANIVADDERVSMSDARER